MKSGIKNHTVRSSASDPPLTVGRPQTSSGFSSNSPEAESISPGHHPGWKPQGTERLALAKPGVAELPLAFTTGSKAPLPKRPKGRLFVGSILCSIAALVGYAIWDAFFRYEAFGVVTGRMITVAAPWDGVVKSLHLREGESFRQGDLLITLDNLSLRQQLDQLHDQLRIAQAHLDSKVSELKYKTRLDDDRAQQASAELYELWGNVLRERAALIDLRATRERHEKIPEDTSLVTRQEREHVRITERGQTAKVKKMIEALKELQKRVDGLRQNNNHGHNQEQLQPDIAHIDSLQKQMAHLRGRIQLGEVRAPVDGRVIKRVRFTGEHVKASEALVEVIEEGSQELVLYMTQDGVKRYAVDQLVRLYVEQLGDCLNCRVVRFGEMVVPAPAGTTVRMLDWYRCICSQRWRAMSPS